MAQLANPVQRGFQQSMDMEIFHRHYERDARVA